MDATPQPSSGREAFPSAAAEPTSNGASLASEDSRLNESEFDSLSLPRKYTLTRRTVDPEEYLNGGASVSGGGGDGGRASFSAPVLADASSSGGVVATPEWEGLSFNGDFNRTWDAASPPLAASARRMAYDYCIVFNATKPLVRQQGSSAMISRELLVSIMRRCGLEVKKFQPPEPAVQNLLYLLVRAPIARLSAEAERTRLRVRVNAPSSHYPSHDKEREGGPVPVYLPHAPEYAIYQTETLKTMPHFFMAQRGLAPPEWPRCEAPETCFSFSSQERARLISAILAAPRSSGGCGIDLDAMVERGLLTQHYPLHDNAERAALRTSWGRFGLMAVWKRYCCKVRGASGREMQLGASQPIDEVRDYFGENVAFYFAFVGSYTRWLVLLAVLLTGLFVVQMYVYVSARGGGEGNEVGWDSALVVPASAVCICLWSTAFLEGWKRNEAVLRMHWKMENLEVEALVGAAGAGEGERSRFKGTARESKIKVALDGTPELEFHYPWLKRILRQMFSYAFVFTLIISVVICTLGIVIFRTWISRIFSSYGAYIAGAANGIVITIFNVFYHSLARALTEFENHRTEDEFQASLILKSFCFQFVNSYTTLYFIAFVKPYAQYMQWTRMAWFDAQTSYQCYPDNDCVAELFPQLISIFLVQIFIQNTEEVVVPMLTLSFKGWYAGYVNRGSGPAASSAPTSFIETGFAGARMQTVGAADLDAPLLSGDGAAERVIRGAKIITPIARDNAASAFGAAPALGPGEPGHLATHPRAGVSSRDLAGEFGRPLGVHAPVQQDYTLRPPTEATTFTGRDRQQAGLSPRSPSVSSVSGLVKRGGKAEPTFVREGRMEPYGDMENFDDYNELVIQFGYVVFFGAACPIVALLALMNNMIEIRADAFKLCTVLQRPAPLRAEGIGAWLAILQTMSIISVLTNCGIVFITSRSLDSFFPLIQTRILLFFVSEHVLYSMRYLIDILVPDVPESVKHAHDREAYRTHQVASAKASEKSLREAGFDDSPSKLRKDLAPDEEPWEPYEGHSGVEVLPAVSSERAEVMRDLEQRLRPNGSSRRPHSGYWDPRASEAKWKQPHKWMTPRRAEWG